MLNKILWFMDFWAELNLDCAFVFSFTLFRFLQYKILLIDRPIVPSRMGNRTSGPKLFHSFTSPMPAVQYIYNIPVNG